jgi:predicted nucleotidyltransferase component of viral defense system
LQIIILKQIYEYKDSKELIFYGWTALRFLFNLNRLSEDLDFVSKDFNNFEELGKHLQKYFKWENIELDYKIQKFRLILKFKNLLSKFSITYWNSLDLYIKIEISDNIDFCEKYEVKIYSIFKFNESLVLKSFDKSTLFSTKLNAILYRNWQKKVWNETISVKWRDIYDLFWYLSNNFSPNLACINWVKDINDLKDKLYSIINKINFKEVILDIEIFLEDKQILNFLKNDGKKWILEKIKEW